MTSLEFILDKIVLNVVMVTVSLIYVYIAVRVGSRAFFIEKQTYTHRIMTFANQIDKRHFGDVNG